MIAASTILTAFQASAAPGDWPQYGFNAAGRRENTQETVLTRKTVPHLVQKWSANIEVAFSSAAVANGIVYVGSGDGHLYAYDARTGAPVWQAATGSSIFSSPAVVDGVVYVGSNDGRVYALDAETGAERWATLAGYGAVQSAVTVADGLVYAGTDGGGAFAITARTGIVKWMTTLHGTIAAPAVARGIAYFADDGGDLDAYDARTGAPIWSTFSTGIIGAPAVSRGMAFADFGSTIGAFDAKTGAARWWGSTGSEGGPIAIGGRHLYGCSEDSVLWDLDTATGAARYETRTGQPMVAAPAVANGVLYAGSMANADSILAYDTANGRLLWQEPVAGGVYAAPTVSNGMLYVGGASQFIAYGLP
jgi:outer membrane protein assembly factor BamB